ncbi:MAG: hypothetical protein JWM68_194 [Verrucomicrobiales bacterium]|nr:hypothetical protein [Verrucomicrobiales bacterium]
MSSVDAIRVNLDAITMVGSDLASLVLYLDDPLKPGQTFFISISILLIVI